MNGLCCCRPLKGGSTQTQGGRRCFLEGGQDGVVVGLDADRLRFAAEGTAQLGAHLHGKFTLELTVVEVDGGEREGELAWDD